jgi:hypothetical protein
VELFTEELGVVHRGEDRVCLTGGVRSDRLEQSWRGGHVEALCRGDEGVVVNEREGTVVTCDARDAGGAVSFVADDEVEAKAGDRLHCGDHFDRLVGGEHDRHLGVG